jgi:hypothetical protein
MFTIVGLIVLGLIAARRAVSPADVRSLISETYLASLGGAHTDHKR